MPSRHDSARAWDARSSRVVVIFRADASTNSRYRTSAVNRESRRAPTSAAASSRFAVSKDRFWTSAMSASTGARSGSVSASTRSSASSVPIAVDHMSNADVGSSRKAAKAMT